ncbi:class I SAM-dependent methyltransferase [Thermophilibacter provencensis]|uniref:class I SAM-dependent methyltransferase n=1 Tax=Thermophilibacter provencensis TaxID=1852386 RepID=UPI0023565CD9|nr:class I SAM-dependent methyltransferase [Thermophilibacter provencensis]
MDEKNAEQLKARTRAAFDAQAATYDAGMEGEHARRLYPHVLGEVRAAVAGLAVPRLLDLGCGTGALAERVLGVAPGAHLTCVDLSPRMAEAARARLAGRAEVLLGDAERLPFHDAGFDAAWCNDSFHHYLDPERAAFQAWRVLAPGGALVIGDAWQPAPARAVMNARLPRSREGDVRIYSEAELRDILGAWFAEVSWRRVGMTACVAVARKGR